MLRVFTVGAGVAIAEIPGTGLEIARGEVVESHRCRGETPKWLR